MNAVDVCMLECQISASYKFVFQIYPSGGITEVKRFKVLGVTLHKVFTEKINKISLSSNDDKRMRSIHSIETYAYGTSKDLVSKKQEIKCNNIIKRYKKMINFDDVTKENIKT